MSVQVVSCNFRAKGKYVQKSFAPPKIFLLLHIWTLLRTFADRVFHLGTQESHSYLLRIFTDFALFGNTGPAGSIRSAN